MAAAHSAANLLGFLLPPLRLRRPLLDIRPHFLVLCSRQQLGSKFEQYAHIPKFSTFRVLFVQVDHHLLPFFQFVVQRQDEALHQGAVTKEKVD